MRSFLLWCHRESNQGHKDFQSFALPTELWHPEVFPLIGKTGLRWKGQKCALRTKAGAKVLLFFELTKFFGVFFAKTCIFGIFFVLLSSELVCKITKLSEKEMELKVIAYARNGHTDKFGIPRQSREESPIFTRIVFEPEFRIPESLRALDGFSHLWLLWGFSETDTWSPTVRPPRLGGNKRVGVFATRSPFRPNPIGLSSVRLIAIEEGDLIVSGADLLDGTPIYDIKPYLSFSDSHPNAQNGFAEETKDYGLKVDREQLLTTVLPLDYPFSNPVTREKWIQDVNYILSQDPRPAYQDDPQREYKLDYGGFTVTFTVKDGTAFVQNIKKI